MIDSDHGGMQVEKQIGQRQISLGKRLWNQRILVVMAFPFFIWMLVFNYPPIAGWVMAFKNYKPGWAFWARNGSG